MKTLDARDFGKDPKWNPEEVDPASILRNRERARKMLAVGEVDWPRGEDWTHRRGDWVSC